MNEDLEVESAVKEVREKAKLVFSQKFSEPEKLVDIVNKGIGGVIKIAEKKRENDGLKIQIMAVLLRTTFNPFVSISFFLWAQLFKHSVKFRSFDRLLVSKSGDEKV